MLALDKEHLHKNNEYYFFCVPFCFIYLFYDQIRGYGLTLRWGTCTGVREGILLGGRKNFALKITICPESNFLV